MRISILLFITVLILIIGVAESKKHRIRLGPKHHHHHHHHHHHKKPVAKHHKHPHVHHVGTHHHHKHHKKHKSPSVVQSSTPVPLFSPPFIGVDNGQIPTDSQVDLIIDYLSKVGQTIDVFLRLNGNYSKGSDDQRNLIKNVYPPLRVLLEAQYAHENKIDGT